MSNGRKVIRITRHGRSAHPWPTQSISAAEFRQWIHVMNQTGIAIDSHPTAELVAMARGVPVVVCSDYLRSIESAARLVPGCAPRVSSLFREVGRPIPGNWRVRFPLTAWDHVSRMLWRADWIATDECVHTARRRAHEATLELGHLAEEFRDVLFVGHGMLNALIGRDLRRLGWRGPRRATDDYWGLSVYRKGG
jgi:broad specificity phosphatase PhoE